jgi:transcriptional regulator with XRE-family HTH domain
MLILTSREFTGEIASRIRALRLENKWSQKELAARAGVHLATYQVFERTGKISLERLYKVATALQREHDFDALFAPLPIRSIDELIPKPTRQRGRTSK